MKSIIKTVLARFGYTLSKSDQAARVTVSTLTESVSDVLAHVSRLGFRPATVIDVGVASGTPSLYQSFPDSFHLLVEPLVEFQSEIESWLRTYQGKAVFAAASSIDGQIQMNVHSEHLDGSSLLHEQMGKEFDGVARTVPSIRVDTVVEDNQLQGPFLVKVDVQGAELEVLDGAKNVLADTELLLLEVSLFKFLKKSPEFYEVVSYLKRLGFVVYDIYGGHRRPLDGALGQCDVAFVKERGRFRNDHRYATPDQWRRLTSS